jgi:hypothetical protein
MASIFELLPGQAQKDELLANFNAAMTPEALGLNVFQQLDVRTLADSFPIQEIQSLQIGSLPSLQLRCRRRSSSSSGRIRWHRSRG